MHILLILGTKFDPLEKLGWNIPPAICVAHLLVQYCYCFSFFLYRVSACKMCNECLRRKYSEEYLDLLERE